MSESMILHHYESSPFAEKIRLMFGYTNSSWHSLLSPAWPPRPNVDPLSGGYRRIPIAQQGADIFCDSALIAQEIAVATNQPTLDPYKVDGATLELMQEAQGDGFFAAITSVSAPKLLGTMIMNFGPVGTYRFIKDRSGILDGGTTAAKPAKDARNIMSGIFDTLEQILGDSEWLGGSVPSAADFAVYHPLWLHLNCGGKFPSAAKNVLRWYEAVSAFGQGQRTEITQGDAFASAKSGEPRPLPASDSSSEFEIGQSLEIQPEDYGVVPVTGLLAAITAERVILKRETRDFGTLHVHFPRAAYALKSAALDSH
ncbi:glutathione S-transferase family protein [Congregibacter brevis]|uniref:Glutathione S-transferase family protein n=1 Tax=Congregibacter brevis TaxID=3081201 RepID=A0ABZ0ID39_9GAMM|nr:glutathione S-transferase family protein [Congregibacter sp. IMCC45268]